MDDAVGKENQSSGSVRRIQPGVAGGDKECGRPAEAGKGKETGSPLEPPEGT